MKPTPLPGDEIYLSHPDNPRRGRVVRVETDEETGEEVFVVRGRSNVPFLYLSRRYVQRNLVTPTHG